MDIMRNWLTPALLAAFLSIQGCGGGGGSSTPAPAPVPVPAPVGTNTIAGPASNVQPISVDAGLGGSVNLAFTSVTLCVPNSVVNCQTIDNIIVDTGSVGLRILSSLLTISLPQQVQASVPVVECAIFADGFSWGPVKLADLTISGEQASSLPIQVIGDPQFSAVPAGCSSRGGGISVATNLNANGILGLGVFRQDCGDACATQVLLNDNYYGCPAAGCKLALTPVALQVLHPVSMFASINNNGVIIELPPVSAAGAVSVSGSLVFGIGTQANNALGAAKVIGVDPSTGNFSTNFNGTNNIPSFMDSGSNGLFFDDGAITPCAIASTTPGFYCPSTTFNGSATIHSIPTGNGTSVTVNFSIANAATLFSGNSGAHAFDNLGGPSGGHGFDWGLPFFYGRNVFTAIEGTTPPGGPAGPYVAF
jgi:hypothetical protein